MTDNGEWHTIGNDRQWGMTENEEPQTDNGE